MTRIGRSACRWPCSTSRRLSITISRLFPVRPVFGGAHTQNRTRLASSSSSSTSSSAITGRCFKPSPDGVAIRVAIKSTRAVVMVESQENGVRLVHVFVAYVEAVQQKKFSLVKAPVKQIGLEAILQAGAMRKVAIYFAEAAGRQIYRIYPPNHPLGPLPLRRAPTHF